MLTLIIGGGETGRKCLLLGLEEENLRRLRADLPIFVDGKTLEPGGWPENFDVAILYGETLEDVARVLREHGMPIPPIPS